MASVNQYPHVRALTVCLACGGGKKPGLIVCWECHNNLKMLHDYGYGPVMDRVIAKADACAAGHIDHTVVIKDGGTECYNSD